MNDETRKCPYCAELVPSAAKICPRCRQWLTTWSLRNPSITIWLYGLPFTILLIFLATFGLNRLNKFLNPSPQYSEAREPLSIVSSQMQWTQSSTEMRLQLVGIMTNHSNIAWKDPVFECRFFDNKGKLIDVGHPHDYFTILPNSDSAFSLRIRPARATNEYSTYKLAITTALNGSGRW